MIQNLTEGLIVSDADGRIVHWNPAAREMHGFTQLDDGVGPLPEFESIFELEHLDGAILPKEQWPLPRILRGEPLQDYEVRIRKIGAEWERILTYNGAILHDSAGKPLAFMTITDVTERKRVDAQIQQLTAELEQRVALRTAELESANKELEAFTYSISHDLRAPLRAVGAFSKAVMEEYGPTLPAEGQHYLSMIRGGAQRMGALIDDLLTFARLTRLPLNKRIIDTDRLVNEAFETLKVFRADRQIDLRIGDLPPSLGDSALLKQVWINLLSNALKYTRHCPEAVIEVGCNRENEKSVFFVRDNGAGFDMRYAHKLFVVFQRLHRAEDYEGTGVGLAIVQRIIQRHGGRIWADAVVDRGATFSFTLSEKQNGTAAPSPDC